MVRKIVLIAKRDTLQRKAQGHAPMAIEIENHSYAAALSGR